MSKRKISQQQRARIKTIQNNFQASAQQTDTRQYQGLVLSRFGRHAEVEIEDKKILHCAIRPNIENIVAGDQVICLEEGLDQGVIVSLLPRQSVLTRSTQHQAQKIIAANITQIIIVAAPIPAPNWLLIDSYLVEAENEGFHPLMIFNKSDLISSTDPAAGPIKDQPQHKAAYISRFHQLGYECIETSCLDNRGFDAFFQKLQHETSVFVGQSGVGKSSLIAACLPDIAIAIATSQHEHGRHTTSNARLYHLPAGGDLIDSPGIRGFDLGHMSQEKIIFGFREFRSRAKQCRFRNCNHRDAPDCAIIRAVSQGECDSTRYESFLTLLGSC